MTRGRYNSRASALSALRTCVPGGRQSAPFFVILKPYCNHDVGSSFGWWVPRRRPCSTPIACNSVRVARRTPHVTRHGRPRRSDRLLDHLSNSLPRLGLVKDTSGRQREVSMSVDAHAVPHIHHVSPSHSRGLGEVSTLASVVPCLHGSAYAFFFCPTSQVGFDTTLKT